MKRKVEHENHVIQIRNTKGEVEYIECEQNTEKIMCKLTEKPL